MERNDWKKHIQIKDNQNYATPGVNVTQFVNSELLKNSGQGAPTATKAPAISKTGGQQVTFSDPENMKKFMETKIKEMQSTESEKIETLKRKINTRIN
jgi:anti-sigma28 factor (negative regulator of flagellin synthesis)